MLILQHCVAHGVRIIDRKNNKIIKFIIVDVNKNDQKAKIKIVNEKETLDELLVYNGKEIYKDVNVTLLPINFDRMVKIGYQAPNYINFVRYDYYNEKNPISDVKKSY